MQSEGVSAYENENGDQSALGITFGYPDASPGGLLGAVVVILGQDIFVLGVIEEGFVDLYATTWSGVGNVVDFTLPRYLFAGYASVEWVAAGLEARTSMNTECGPDDNPDCPWINLDTIPDGDAESVPVLVLP